LYNPNRPEFKVYPKFKVKRAFLKILHLERVSETDGEDQIIGFPIARGS